MLSLSLDKAAGIYLALNLSVFMAFGVSNEKPWK
jgi:hypothetical protein